MRVTFSELGGLTSAVGLSTTPRYNERLEYALCHSNGDPIGLPSHTNAATWAVVNAFKSTLDTFQLKCNVWEGDRGRYDSTRMNAGMQAAVRLISYWTFGTDQADISTEKSRSGIRASLWGCEESQQGIPDFGKDSLGRMKYHRNFRALSESIGAQSWLEARPQRSVSGLVKTDVDTEQVAVYLKKEYQLLCESLKNSYYKQRDCHMQELYETLFRPLQKEAEEFETVMGGDPAVASLVKSEWIVSFDRAFDEAKPREAGSPL